MFRRRGEQSFVGGFLFERRRCLRGGGGTGGDVFDFFGEDDGRVAAGAGDGGAKEGLVTGNALAAIGAGDFDGRHEREI